METGVPLNQASYPESRVERSRWIVGLRPEVNRLGDGDRPVGFSLETERGPDGEIWESVVVLIKNRECPWRCLMCDLWKETTKEPLSPGQVIAQIRHALCQLRITEKMRGSSRKWQIKLYNGGSFFDRGAIPVADYPTIARLVDGFERIVVECHPNLIGQEIARFRDLLQGKLEVALGLESSDPAVLAYLNKGFDLFDFESAVQTLRSLKVDWRAFTIFGLPSVPMDDQLASQVRSAEYAQSLGASVITIIPARSGNGAMDRLLEEGVWRPPSFLEFERVFSESLASVTNRSRCFVDLWDLETMASCRSCFQSRRSRLEQMNLAQSELPSVVCDDCRHGISEQ